MCQYAFVKIGFTRLLLLLVISSGAHAQVERYVEGVHYTQLNDNGYLAELGSAKGQADVLEIFWYGCGFCKAFDPLLNAWVQEQGDAITFSRKPIVWDDASSRHARLFFAARQLDILAEVHDGIFAAIHEQRNMLLDERAMSSLLKQHGVEPARFTAAWSSFAVDAAMRKTHTQQREMHITAVPALAVNGRWLVNVNQSVATHAAMLDVVEFLLNKEQAATTR